MISSILERWQGLGKAITIPGIFLQRLPSFRSRPSSVAIEINPVDSASVPAKKRGIVIRSRLEYDQIRNILGNGKVSQLANSIDEVNPEIKLISKRNKEEDIFEI
jgi:acetylglutamate synthase